jgi:hypothetical protein
MPVWLHPVLRTLQEDQETLGLIKPINSPPVIEALAREAAGVILKPVIHSSRTLLGTVFQH